MGKAYQIKNDAIIINRDLTQLDLFVKDFLKVITKHTGYLIVSGFISISTGRARGTEDVDILIPIMPFEKFRLLFDDLIKNNFWCYQGDSAKSVYEYIENKNNIRFARKNEVFPNMEFIPIDESRKAKYYEFKHPQKIKIKDFLFLSPPIEFEILYKEIVLAGKKDIADAKHLRTIFSKTLKEKKFKEYEPIIRSELK